MDQYEKSWPSWEYLCTVRLIASSQIVYQVIKFGCTKKGASDGQYRVTHLLADMGWVGLTLIWDDPQGVGLYCSCSAARARQRNILNLNQPNPGPRGDGSPCRQSRGDAKGKGSCVSDAVGRFEMQSQISLYIFPLCHNVTMQASTSAAWDDYVHDLVTITSKR